MNSNLSLVKTNNKGIDNPVTNKRLFQLIEDINNNYLQNGISIFSLLRFRYLSKYSNTFIKRICKNLEIRDQSEISSNEIKLEKVFRFFDENKIDWGDLKFHLNYSIHLNKKSTTSDFDLLFSLVELDLEHKNILFKIILDGVEVKQHDSMLFKDYYDLRILPLNLMLGLSVTNYFVPPKDYLIPHDTKSPDPYGLISGKSRVSGYLKTKTGIIDEQDNLFLGSHKFTHTFLLNLDFYCPIGCSDCYKTRFGTREYYESLTGYVQQENPYFNVKTSNKGKVIDHIERVVNWLNNDSRGNKVYDIILSGGEPLMFSNEVINLILQKMSRVKELKILRICTGTLFLGLPFRFDDELVKMLEEFTFNTGIKITIQAHLGSIEMISHESLIAIYKLKKSGIPIYSQVPIKNNINFFLDDPDKTVQYIADFCHKQVIAGVEPYMFIVDMHPSTNEFYVPLEPLLMMWARLVESHNFPGLERPKTLSILFNQGNIILNGNHLITARKVIDNKNNKVTYFIPLINSENWKANIGETFVYEEPLTYYNNDSKSLDNIRDLWFSA